MQTDHATAVCCAYICGQFPIRCNWIYLLSLMVETL